MMKTFVLFLFCLAITSALTLISSCGKETTTAPEVELVAGVGNVSKDTSLYRGTTFRLQIRANKTGTEGLLTSCKIVKSINGGADSTIQEMNFLTQYFSNSYAYLAGDSGQVERYTVTVVEKDGLSSSVSVTVTDI